MGHSDEGNSGTMHMETGRSCLHLVLSADPETWHDCLRHSAAEDEYVLVDAGVMLITDKRDLWDEPMGASVYWMAADLQARGLETLADGLGARIIDDSVLVKLVCKHRHSLSWL